MELDSSLMDRTFHGRSFLTQTLILLQFKKSVDKNDDPGAYL